MKYKYPKVTKEPDGKPNLTVYVRVYHGKKFNDMEPVDLLPNDSLVVMSGNPVMVCARSVFNDTKTIHDSTPTNIDSNTQYTIHYTRNLNDKNIENRNGITKQIRLV